MATLRSPLEMFYHWEQTTPDKVYLRQPVDRQWHEFTWKQVGDRVRRVASFLEGFGLEPGSRIAIWSSNSMDWFVVDLAIMMSGHVSVPLFPGQDADSARYILEHSGACMAFLGAFDQAAQADEAIPDEVIRVAMMGCRAPCQYSLQQVIQEFAPKTESPLPALSDLFTIIYTSGTTGKPKGAMHVYSSPATIVPEEAKTFGHVVGEARYISFLPLSHVAERILVEMSSLYSNGTVSFSQGVTTFAQEMREVDPTFMFSVPRIWMKLKEGVEARLPKGITLSDEQKAGIIKQLGLSRATCTITGGAPCPVDVQKWFIDLGLPLKDGYGMTETLIDGLAIPRNEPPIPGCVGKPLACAEVRISEEGEILFRTPAMMIGYYKEPEKTAAVLKDGWYHSGDAGRIDENGNLWITGRVSDVFKTNKGKFVEPAPLEDRLAANPGLAQVVVFGHGLTQPVAVANISELGRSVPREELAASIKATLDQINAVVPHHERLSQIYVAKDEWTIPSGMLTPTLKLKRKPLEARYRPLIEAHVNDGPVVFEE